jgi:hypothetical protein
VLASVSFLRTRVFAILIALLTLGGYGYELYAHAAPKCESTAEHQHSNSDEKGGCHHCTCHCSPPVMANIDRVVAFQAPTFVGYAATRGEILPDAVPVGIDHPPQLA